MFVDPAHDDYRLQPQSPALQLGFEPIPFEKIGPYQDDLRASWPIVERKACGRHWPDVELPFQEQNRVSASGADRSPASGGRLLLPRQIVPRVGAMVVPPGPIVLVSWAMHHLDDHEATSFVSDPEARAVGLWSSSYRPSVMPEPTMVLIPRRCITLWIVVVICPDKCVQPPPTWQMRSAPSPRDAAAKSRVAQRRSGSGGIGRRERPGDKHAVIVAGRTLRSNPAGLLAGYVITDTLYGAAKAMKPLNATASYGDFGGEWSSPLVWQWAARRALPQA